MSEVDCITEVGCPRQFHCPFQEREETPLTDTGGGGGGEGGHADTMHSLSSPHLASGFLPLPRKPDTSPAPRQHLLCRICIDQTPSQPRFPGCWLPAPAALHPSLPVWWTKDRVQLLPRDPVLGLRRAQGGRASLYFLELCPALCLHFVGSTGTSSCEGHWRMVPFPLKFQVLSLRKQGE